MINGKTEVIGDQELIDEFVNFSNSEGSENLSLSQAFKLSSYADGLVQFLTVGGGLIGLSKCIIEYLKIKHKTRRIKIKKEDGSELEIEASSSDELVKILSVAEVLIIENKE